VTGNLLRVLEDHRAKVWSVAFDPTGARLISAAVDGSVALWDAASGRLLHHLDGHLHYTRAIFHPEGYAFISGGRHEQLTLWDPAIEQASTPLIELRWAHPSRPRSEVQVAALTHPQAEGFTYDLSVDSQGSILAAGTSSCTIQLWDLTNRRLRRTLEGHIKHVQSVSLFSDGSLLASKSLDGTIRLWSTQNGACLAAISEPPVASIASSIVFHPQLHLLAAVGADLNSPAKTSDRVIHIYKLNPALLLQERAEPSANYVNAKTVLVGDTGVGKTGLSLVLNGLPYKETDSTAGRHVWTLDTRIVQVGAALTQTRETLLWDLAGQPGYRVIHQLHLNEVAVALVVFDARSEIDPLAGVRHWERALRLAKQRQGASGVPMKKFLVSARNDRGGVPISEDRLETILKEFGFHGYFKTSAREGWQIKELLAAIQDAIPWENLPEVSSSQLFTDIKSFLMDVKRTGRLLAPAIQLFEEFSRTHADKAIELSNLRDQFDTCIGRLGNRDLIRRLTFGDYVLLQPELLDAYASAMVNAAKEEPDGLGSIAEEVALAGRFFVPKEQRVSDPGQEQLLLHATLEELARHDLALRENADDGRYLVLPSQFNRDYEDAPEPKGKAVAITFDGPVQSLYATLAVRLGHSGLFSTRRAEMWRNAAIFNAAAGGKCGLFLNEFAEGRGRLILFFPDEKASVETRFHFEEFVLAHAKRRALIDTVEVTRFFVCAECGDPVPDSYVKRLREKGKKEFPCPCGAAVPLTEPKERLTFRSRLEAMDKSADTQRDFEAFVMSAKGETSTRDFLAWAGGEHVTLAIAFTDIVGSTALGEELRDEAMDEVRHAHFARSRKLIAQFKGRELKTIGDSFMAAFKSVNSALDYARALQSETGHPLVAIRAGIHIGQMKVEEADVFGGTVNFAARVIGAIKDAEIWLSDRAKHDIDELGAQHHKALSWQRHENVPMKGFKDLFTLWSLKRAHS
jgi:class 3 adenylate cyclase/GTPase SAR1 family protein